MQYASIKRTHLKRGSKYGSCRRYFSQLNESWPGLAMKETILIVPSQPSRKFDRNQISRIRILGLKICHLLRLLALKGKRMILLSVFGKKSTCCYNEVGSSVFR